MAAETLLKKNFVLGFFESSHSCTSLGKFQITLNHGGLQVVNQKWSVSRGSVCKGRFWNEGKRLKCDVTVRSAMVMSTTEKETEGEKNVPAGSVSVVLLAGGVGKRMGANMPKQYLPLFNQPIALYSFYLFSELPEVGEIVVVCDSAYKDIFLEAAEKISIPMKFALPGQERQDSVFNGLQEISEDASLVAVHDSARPLVTESDTRKVMRDALEHGAAVLGVPVKATIKEAGSSLFVTKTLDRRLLWEMQTPQVIKPSLLREGFELVRRQHLEVTDDVSIVEYLNHPVRITHGSYTNLKVTTPDDLLLAERILSEHMKKP